MEYAQAAPAKKAKYKSKNVQNELWLIDYWDAHQLLSQGARRCQKTVQESLPNSTYMGSN